MKKFILFGFLLTITMAVAAQQTTTQPPGKKEKKKLEKDRRNALANQEEEGVLAFTKQTAFGAQLRTNGYGAFIEIGRSRSPRFTNLYTFEFTEIKHPKEEKTSGSTLFSNAFVYGKINNFYQAKLGFGQQYIFGQKGNKNGVAVLGIVNGGLSVGLLKPYYIQAEDQSNVQREIKYDSKDSLLFLNGNINGGAGFFKGWNELKIKPGAYIKTALRFDFGRYNESIQALEIGMSLDYYTDKISQMVFNEPKNLFFQGHIAFVFGKRK